MSSLTVCKKLRLHTSLTIGFNVVFWVCDMLMTFHCRFLTGNLLQVNPVKDNNVSIRLVSLFIRNDVIYKGSDQVSSFSDGQIALFVAKQTA